MIEVLSSNVVSCSALDALPNGRYNLGVPVLRGSVQVECAPKHWCDESRLYVEREDATVSITMADGSPLQIRAAWDEVESSSQKRVVREGHVFWAPVDQLELEAKEDDNLGVLWQPYASERVINPEALKSFLGTVSKYALKKYSEKILVA